MDGEEGSKARAIPTAPLLCASHLTQRGRQLAPGEVRHRRRGQAGVGAQGVQAHVGGDELGELDPVAGLA